MTQLALTVMGQNPIQEVFSMDGSNADRFFTSLRNGNTVYFAGQTSSSDFPVTNALQESYGGDEDEQEPGDMILAKYNADTEQVQWATYLGGSGSETATGLSLDGQGNLLVSGWTTSTDFPTLNPIQSSNAGGSDAVIVKISPEGQLLFSTYLGGAGDDQLSDTARDETNESTVFCGFSTSIDFPLPENNPSTADTGKPAAGNADYVVLSLNDDNSLKWVTMPDTRRNLSGNDVAQSVVVDSDGFVLVTGYTESSNFVNNTQFGRHQGGRELFLSKIQGSNADRIDSVLFGGSGDDAGNDVIISGFGVALVVGQTNSTDIDLLTRPTLQTSYGGGESDALLVAFSYRDFRMPRRGSYFGGSGDDFARTAFLDPNNLVHVGGATSSSDLPFSLIPGNDPAQAAYGGGDFDGFLLNLRASLDFTQNPSISLTSAEYFGGAGDETITSLHLSPFEGAPANAFSPYPIAFSAFQIPAGATPLSLSPFGPRDEAHERLTRTLYYAVRPLGLLPDLVVGLKPVEPLAVGQVSEVEVEITNVGTAPAISIDVLLELDKLISGEETGRIVSAYFNDMEIFDDEFENEFVLPQEANLLPSQSLVVVLNIEAFPAALIASPPGISLHVNADPTGPDAAPSDNDRRFQLPVTATPDIAVELLNATQSPTHQNPVTASYTFKISNLGFSDAQDVKLLVRGSGLMNVTYQLGPAGPQPIQNLNDPTLDIVIPVGSLGAGEEVQLDVNGTLIGDPQMGAFVQVTGSDPLDFNIENNTESFTTAPANFYDYSVKILSQSVQFQSLNGATVLTMETRAQIQLSILGELPLSEINPAVLTTRHTGSPEFLSVVPATAGQCLDLNPFTHQCTFPVSAFVQAGEKSGVVELNFTDRLDANNIPLLPSVTLSVEGDGQLADRPNNFAEGLVEMSQRGRLSLTRVSHNARTIQLPDGTLAVVVTQRVKARNDGPGSVQNIRVTLGQRDKNANIGGGIHEPATIIDGASNGVSVTTNSAEEIVEIATLDSMSEVIIELSDRLPLSAAGDGEVLGDAGVLGEMTLTAPPGTDLTQSGFPTGVLVDDVLADTPDRSIEFLGTSSPDVSVQIEEQRLETQVRNGIRTPVLVTVIAVKNEGALLAKTVELSLVTSGLVPGASITKGSVIFLNAPFTQPDPDQRPEWRLLDLGDLQPGERTTLTLRDDVADASSDHLLSVRAVGTHASFDRNLTNNIDERETEYQASLQSIDYGVLILTQTQEILNINGANVPVIRTRVELSIDSGTSTENLPPFHLEFHHPGASNQFNLIPKNPTTPQPAGGIQCQAISALETHCDFSANIARDYLLEFIDTIITPGEARPILTRAEITGDGELPATNNNNLATESLEYQPNGAPDLIVEEVDGLNSSSPVLYRVSFNKTYSITNQSATVTAKDVRVNFTQRYLNALPAGTEPLMSIFEVTGDAPDSTRICLKTGTTQGCLLGDIEPGGQRILTLHVDFDRIPESQQDRPFQVTLGLHAEAAGELVLENNDANSTHAIKIPIIEFIGTFIQDGKVHLRMHILKPEDFDMNDGFVIESSHSVNGPWTSIKVERAEDTDILEATVETKDLVQFFRPVY